MILIAWFIAALVVALAGLVIWQPWWFKNWVDSVAGEPKYFCKKCHRDITVGDKIRAEFNDMNKLEDRQV